MITQTLNCPLSTEPRRAGLAGEKLLHGGLFEVALFSDQFNKSSDQRIYVGEGSGDSTLFIHIWKPNFECLNTFDVQNARCITC